MCLAHLVAALLLSTASDAITWAHCVHATRASSVVLAASACRLASPATAAFAEASAALACGPRLMIHAREEAERVSNQVRCSDACQLYFRSIALPLLLLCT
jgi:hypothetical protein